MHNQTSGSGELKESLILCQTNTGVEVRGTLIKLSRFCVMFEVYGPTVLQMSEVLTDFKILVDSNTIYSGNAIVCNILDTGQVLICEVSLAEDSWRDVKLDTAMMHNGAGQAAFGQFFNEWQKIYKVLPEYKIVVGDIHVFLTDLRLWLEQFELGIRAMPAGDRSHSEREMVGNLVGPVSTSLNYFFEKFETVTRDIDQQQHPVHALYVKRQLHSLLLCSPFMHRIFRKPLGYAGDYEMVNMILRDPHEGASVFAKVLNRWFLSQMPAEAHRNRVKFLTQRIAEESLRLNASGRKLRVFNLGCGPAREISDFMEHHEFANKAEFTLLDFSEETLNHTKAALNATKNRYQRNTSIQMVKKSVANLLKASSRNVNEEYDLIYCAGLFDYLQDRVCKQLMNLMYRMLAPGGLLIATNVDSVNPIQNIMGLIFEWHLIYRNNEQFSSLAPDDSSPDEWQVFSDLTGCNIFIEVRKKSS
ncbi:MAG: class I SAM-dependent methyltransferase [Verrucomicrobiota bacterium]